MWVDGTARTDLLLPVWQHGKRVHGYWLGEQRVGHVSLPPRGCPRATVRAYSWEIDAAPDLRGEEPTLRAAKRRVEVAFRRVYSWRFPESRGKWWF